MHSSLVDQVGGTQYGSCVRRSVILLNVVAPHEPFKEFYSIKVLNFAKDKWKCDEDIFSRVYLRKWKSVKER